MKPQLIILCGLPCSGKSTYAKKFYTYKILSSDNYIEEIAKQKNKTYNEIFSYTIREATANFYEEVNAAAQTNYNVIIDRTNLKISTRKYFINKFKNHEKTIVFFNTPLETIKARNTRVGKIIPDKVLEDMYISLEIPTSEEGTIVTL
jgi:predicted kinase